MNGFLNLEDRSGFSVLRSNLVVINPAAAENEQAALASAEMMPQEGDYIFPRVRALSAAYLGHAGYYLDFSRKDVLKNSIPLMLLKSAGGSREKALKVQRNHSYNIENTIGHIKSNEWDGSKKLGHPGINAELSIDTVLAADDARRIMSNPPLIDSVSMAVGYKWEHSHPEMRFWTFIDLLGQEVDGEIVRFVVTEIIDYDHIGLVWSGGDTSAGFLNKYQAQFSEKVEKGKGRWILDDQVCVLGATQEDSGTLKKSITLPDDRRVKVKSPNRRKNMSEVLTGLTIKNLSQFQELLGLEIKDEGDLLEAITGLSEANVELREEVQELKPLAELGEKAKAAVRENVLRLAKILQGENFSKDDENRLEKADYEMLQYLEKDYQRQVEEKFPQAGRRSSEEELENGGEVAATVNEADYITG